MLKKCGLPADNTSRDLEQRLIANLEAAYQPARLLQLRSQHGMVATAAQQSRVLLVDRQARHTGRADLNQPAVVDLADEDVRNDIFCSSRADREARLRITALDQGESIVELFFCRTQVPAQRAQTLARDQIEVIRRQLDRKLEPRGCFVELTQLQNDAFGNRTRAYARRIKPLDESERFLHLVHRETGLGIEAADNILEIRLEVTVIVDRVDDSLTNDRLAGREVLHLELP